MTNEAVRTERHGDVAVLVIDNPPVNALSHHMRVALDAQLRAAAEDPGVRAIVLAGDGRTLCAGADLRQLGRPPADPQSADIFLRIAASPKPVVAVIHGATLGGGFELALACHARVAAPGAEMGLPELKLGLIPGAGGTFRLPRIVGATAALGLIAESRRIGADEALSLGLVDRVDGDPRRAAIELARDCAASGPARAAPRPSDRDSFEAAAAKVLARSRGAEAPAALVMAVRNAFDLDEDAAQAAEQKLFQGLRVSPQSTAMRHLFFAERQAARLPHGVTGTPGPLARVAVIGAGTMGGGIAMCFADAGLPATLIDAKPEVLKAGLARIRKNYEISASRGRITAEDVAVRMALIQPAETLTGAADADLVIEAVFEDLDLKRRLFAELDATAPAHAILASNTSSLDMDAIAAATSRPGQVVGLHFFSPANVMRLLEIVRGTATSGDTMASVLAVAARIGKQPVLVGNCPGFVGNRILRQRHHQAEALLQQGASPAAVDAAVTEFGMAMGPFQMNDLAGLDVSQRVRQSQGYTLPIADALCAMGRHGQKTGAGYYRYDDGRTPVPDPETDRVITEVAARLGVARREFGPDEILARLFYPMVNEAARVLAEGIAARPGDIDVIYVHGYGFPAWRGGLMHWADRVGLPKIVSALADWAQETGEDRLRPAPLLAELAAKGQGFAEWQADREGNG